MSDGSQREWRFYLDDMIEAARNRLIHGYLGIDQDIIWSMVQDDIPELLKLLQAMKNKVLQ
jgi:uncharacterized protein with HEPN domain